MKTLLKSILILLCTTSLAACNPFKVTDPNDPKFDPAKFQFSDYPDFETASNVLNEIFPLGTKDTKVNSLLLENLNLLSSEKVYIGEDKKNKYSVYYFFPNDIKKSKNSYVWVVYDKENLVSEKIVYDILKPFKSTPVGEPKSIRGEKNRILGLSPNIRTINIERKEM